MSPTLLLTGFASESDRKLDNKKLTDAVNILNAET